MDYFAKLTYDLLFDADAAMTQGEVYLARISVTLEDLLK